MHDYIRAIGEKYLGAADPRKAASAKKYLLNQFEHFGIPTPERRKVNKAHFTQSLPAPRELPRIVKELWNMPQREYQYFAVELMSVFERQWKKNIISLFEYCLTRKSWWDTVDNICGELLFVYFRKFPAQASPVTGKWNKSDNIWLQRASIIFQNGYKQELNKSLLGKHILRVADSKEFFVQKAIGWALREYSKTDPGWVKKFVGEHALPRLSTREALRRLKKN